MNTDSPSKLRIVEIKRMILVDFDSDRSFYGPFLVAEYKSIAVLLTEPLGIFKIILNSSQNTHHKYQNSEKSFLDSLPEKKLLL